MNRRARGILAFVVATVVVLGAVEGLARLVYTAPWYDRLVTAQTEIQAREYRKNADGLRDRDYGPKAPGDVRILMLGDSFTYGLGVDEDAPFPRLVERALGADANAPRVEVLNGGISGSLTGSWVKLLQRVQPRFEPDLILLVFFLRDGTRLTSQGDFFGPIRTAIVERNHGSALYRHSYVFRMIRDRLDRDLLARDYVTVFDRSYFGTPQETQEWIAAERNIGEIRDLAKKRGAKVGLVVFPVLVDLDRTYPFERIHKQITTFTQANGIPTFDLLPAFRGRKAETLWVAPLDQHPSPEAHAIAAEAMLPFIRSLLNRPASAATPGA